MLNTNVNRTLTCLQHEPTTADTLVERWAKARGIELKIIKTWQTETWPASTTDLIIFGGDMNVDQEALHPWLKQEKLYIERSIREKKRILGLCLGAQLISRVLGARVYPHKWREYGWHPVKKTTQNPKFEYWPQEISAFQLHRDTFDLPFGAERLWSNDICQNQGFSYSDHVLATQFHPEATPEWIEESYKEIVPRDEQFVQSFETVKRLTSKNFPIIEQAFFSLLDQFFIVM